MNIASRKGTPRTVQMIHQALERGVAAIAEHAQPILKCRELQPQCHLQVLLQSLVLLRTRTRCAVAQLSPLFTSAAQILHTHRSRGDTYLIGEGL